MTLHPQFIIDIPEETYRVAKAIFPQGNLYIQMRKLLELLKSRSKQGTDSTHILASIRMLNRLEQVG